MLQSAFPSYHTASLFWHHLFIPFHLVEIIAENEGDGDADKEESLALLDQDKLLQKLEVSMTLARKVWHVDC